MNSHTPALQPEDLLRHEPWLRRLLARLVAPDEVDDAMQNTWLAVLGKEPRQRSRLKSWLRTVARNVAIDTLRARRRRHALHTAASPQLQTESSAEACARLELQQQVVESVLALPEIYRDAILRRYYWEHSVVTIAEEFEITQANVRQRLTRGSAMLQRKLADTYGEDWRRCAPVLAVLRSAETVPMVAAAPAVAALAFALVAVPVLAWQLWPTDQPPTSAPAIGTAVAAGDRAQTGAVGGADDTFSPPSPPARTRVSADHKPLVQPPLRGRVVDRYGRPLADVAVGILDRVVDKRDFSRVANAVDLPLAVIEGFEELARTDQGGGFTLTTDIPIMSSLIAGPPLAPLVSFGITETYAENEQVILVAARTVSIAGRIVDADGRVIPNCPIGGTLLPLTDVTTDWSASMPVQWSRTHAAADGSFRLDGLPAAAMDLQFGRWKPTERAVPAASADHWLVVHDAPATPVLSGTVFGPGMQPARGVRVGVGQAATHTDSDGHYEVAVPTYVESPANCYVIATGFEVVQHSIELTGTLTWNPQLMRRSASICGRVVDGAGHPVPDLTVHLWSSTDLGHGIYAEGLATFNLAPNHAVPRFQTATDSQGRFTLEELCDRRYRLVLSTADRKSVQRTAALSPDVREHHLVWAPATRRVTGTVVDSSGQPVPDISIQRDWRCAEDRLFTASTQLGPTDEAGAFLAAAPPAWARASYTLSGSGWAVSTTRLARGWTPDHITLVAHRECSFHVALTDNTAGADSFQLLDAAGVPLEILRMRGFGGALSDVFELTDGKSEVLTVGAQATTLVLLRADEEVGRIAVTLHPGAVNRLGS